MSPAELGFNTGQASPYGQTSGVAGMMNTVFNIKIDTTSNEFDKKMSMFSKDITRSMISMQQNNVK
jgi:hypothetical protein